MTTESERLVPRYDYKDRHETDLSELGRAAYEAYGRCDGDVRRSFQAAARAVLEAAGVERLRARANELENDRDTQKARGDGFKEAWTKACQERDEQRARADRAEKTEPLRPAKGRAYHCAACGKDHSGRVPDEWQCECGGVVIDPNLMHPHTEEQQKARADAAEEKLKAERAEWSKRLTVLEELRNDLAPEFLEPQEDDYAIPNAVRELFHLWKEQLDHIAELEAELSKAKTRAESAEVELEESCDCEELEAELERLREHIETLRAAQTVNVDELKARADRALGALRLSGECNVRYVRKIAALEKVVEAARGDLEQFGQRESVRCEIKALDSAQPAPDARDEPETVGDRLRLIRQLNERDERIRELEAELERLRRGQRAADLEAELYKNDRDTLERRTRELEAAAKQAGEEYEVLDALLQETALKEASAYQRGLDAADEELQERIRVACADLRHLANYSNSPGAWRATCAVECDRIARELEGKDSGVTAAREPVKEHDGTPGKAEGWKPSAPGGSTPPRAADHSAPLPGGDGPTEPLRRRLDALEGDVLLMAQLLLDGPITRLEKP